MKASFIRYSVVVLYLKVENFQGGETEILLAMQGNNLIRDVCNINVEASTILGMQKTL